MKHPNIAVIIPSRNPDNLAACAEAVKQLDPYLHIIAVWDRSEKTNLPYGPAVLHVDQWVEVREPFCFARNVNRGILAAGDREGYVILNDDALLRTPGGFTSMYWQHKTRSDFGVIASVTNVVGNENQKPSSVGLREEPRMVCFVSVLIPLSTVTHPLMEGGMLDEEFVDYGMEDDSYCKRVRESGLKIGIFDGCYVDHGCLRSQFEMINGRDFKPNLRRYIKKWGVDNTGLDKNNSPWRELFD